MTETQLIANDAVDVERLAKLFQLAYAQPDQNQVRVLRLLNEAQCFHMNSHVNGNYELCLSALEEACAIPCPKEVAISLAAARDGVRIRITMKEQFEWCAVVSDSGEDLSGIARTRTIA